MTRFAQLTLEGFAAPSAKIVALAKVEQHADPDWMKVARAQVDDLATLYDEFTTDHVWDFLDMPEHPKCREPRAMGAVMRKAAADGVIAATGRYEQSHRPECHQRPIMIWRSLVR